MDKLTISIYIVNYLIYFLLFSYFLDSFLLSNSFALPMGGSPGDVSEEPVT